MHLALKKLTQPWQWLWLCCVGSIKTRGDLLGFIDISWCILRCFMAFYCVFIIIVSCQLLFQSAVARCFHSYIKQGWMPLLLMQLMVMPSPPRTQWQWKSISPIEKRRRNRGIFWKSPSNSRNSFDSSAAARKRLRSDLHASTLKTWTPNSPKTLKPWTVEPWAWNLRTLKLHGTWG